MEDERYYPQLYQRFNQVVTLDLFGITVPRWKICCPSLDETIYRITVPYEIPIQDTLDHEVGKALADCTVTGITSKSFGNRHHKA